jgi:hypothetical protein
VKFKLINFIEKRLEIPFYQTNNPDDAGAFFI